MSLHDSQSAENWWSSSLDYAAVSNVGMQRTNNQDAHIEIPAASKRLWRDRGHFFMVADGMGAHAAGERASEMAVLLTSQSYTKRTEQLPHEAIRDAIADAHVQIKNQGNADEAFRSMGTTADVLLLLPEGALNAHVGDSRTYRLRGGWYEQITFDHSLVWELTRSGKVDPAQLPPHIPKNVITRSLGPGSNPKVDLEGPFPLRKGDTFLLCSDGLSGQVEDAEMGQILALLPPAKAVQALVSLANLSGGPDNVTVTVVKVLDLPDPEDHTGEQKPAVKRDPIPPAAWGALGAAFGLTLMSVLLLRAEVSALFPILSLAAAFGSIAAFFALARKSLFPPKDRPHRDARFGRGPYSRVSAEPAEPFAEKLLGYCRKLDEATRARISEQHRRENDRLFRQSGEAFARRDWRQSILLSLEYINNGYGALWGAGAESAGGG
ncbi:MAG: serine/threonine-protein phosphatase [Thermoguttaceae bacterium]|nr:serine/threonine-protein phosphatase [Thermoguttaceae bacterium]